MAATVAVVAVLAAACGSEAGPGDTGSVWGRTFLSTSVGEAGVARPLVEGTQVRLAFSDGRLTASAGCNTMSGEVSLDGGRLVVSGGLATTEMGCDPPRHAQDEWLAGFLGGRPIYRLDAGRLTLTAGGTEIVLVDRRTADPDRPLEGTEWRLDGIVDGEVVSTVPGQVVATLRVTGGRLDVAVEGCNSGSGDVVVGAGELRIGTRMTTLIGCPPDPAAVEDALAAVLRGTVAYRVEAATLTLTSRDGKGLVFRAAA